MGDSACLISLKRLGRYQGMHHSASDAFTAYVEEVLRRFVRRSYKGKVAILGDFSPRRIMKNSGDFPFSSLIFMYEHRYCFQLVVGRILDNVARIRGYGDAHDMLHYRTYEAIWKITQNDFLIIDGRAIQMNIVSPKPYEVLRRLALLGFLTQSLIAKKTWDDLIADTWSQEPLERCS